MRYWPARWDDGHPASSWLHLLHLSGRLEPPVPPVLSLTCVELLPLPDCQQPREAALLLLPVRSGARRPQWEGGGRGPHHHHQPPHRPDCYLGPGPDRSVTSWPALTGELTQSVIAGWSPVFSSWAPSPPSPAVWPHLHLLPSTKITTRTWSWQTGGLTSQPAPAQNKVGRKREDKTLVSLIALCGPEGL